MTYNSTRGGGKPAPASAAILMGAAGDGGLFVPERFPAYTPDNLCDMDYETLAFEVLRLYLTDYTEGALRGCVRAAYGQGFEDAAIAPIARAGGVYFLELFHGRTAAFKDMALSILPYLMKEAKNIQGITDEIVILTATSGDTGGAALAGFAGVEGFKCAVFYPEGGVSDIQRAQMVSRGEGNVLVCGVKGNFDDAQRGVKAAFADGALAGRLAGKGVRLSSANSINIGRLLPQIVYYYYAYGQLVKGGEIGDGERIDFVVPTGNFGNILAGHYARRMGLPIGRLVCASNTNNVLYDFFTTGIYNAKREFALTVSPSMDILVSSNLERLLYDLCGSGERVSALMRELSETGEYRFGADFEGFAAAFADEGETISAIGDMARGGYVMDPHTAVAYAAWRKLGGGKAVVLATASPYKFGAAMARAGVALDKAKAPASIRALEGAAARQARVCEIGEIAELAGEFAGR